MKPSHVHKLLAQLEAKGSSGSTRRQVYHVLRLALSEAVDESSRYHAVLALIAATGVRRGEALALKWTDVDLKERTMRISGTLARVGGALVVTEPKTAKSRRSLALSPSVVRLLRVHKASQRIERVAAANIWTNTGYVFTTESGQPVDPRNIFRALQVAAKKSKITGDVYAHVSPDTARAAMATLSDAIGL